MATKLSMELPSNEKQSAIVDVISDALKSIFGLQDILFSFAEFLFCQRQSTAAKVINGPLSFKVCIFYDLTRFSKMFPSNVKTLKDQEDLAQMAIRFGKPMRIVDVCVQVQAFFP